MSGIITESQHPIIAYKLVQMDEECWDNCDNPPYIPQVMNMKIIRKVPPKLSRSQKKKFREEERKRWDRIIAEEKLVQHEIDIKKQ